MCVLPGAGLEAECDLPGDNAPVSPPTSSQEPREPLPPHTASLVSCVHENEMHIVLTHSCGRRKHPPPPLLQVYRSVLLNNGRRTPPTPDSPSDEGEKVQSPPATRTTAKSPSLVEAEHSKKSPSPGEAEPVVKQELSGMGRMTEGERGDIIHFYNKVHF